MVHACASGCKEWFLGKRKLSSFRLGIEIELPLFRGVNIDMEIPACPHLLNRIPHYMDPVFYSILSLLSVPLVFSLSFAFFFLSLLLWTLGSLVSAEWLVMPSSSGYSGLVFVS